jgi:hypothetical protein
MLAAVADRGSAARFTSIRRVLSCGTFIGRDRRRNEGTMWSRPAEKNRVLNSGAHQSEGLAILVVFVPAFERRTHLNERRKLVEAIRADGQDLKLRRAPTCQPSIAKRGH